MLQSYNNLIGKMMRGFGDLGGGPSNGGQAPDCKQQIKSCWDQVPFWNRVVLITCTTVYLVSFGLPQILMWMVCAPQMIIYSLQIWRVTTGPFVHTQLLEFLFSIISYIPTACITERKIGTVKMAHRFLLMGTFINIIFTVICGIFGINQLSVGLWPLLFAEIVIECMQHPEQARGLCCLPIQIKSKYYPVVLLLLFSLFFGLQISLFVGLGVGYMHHYGLLNWADLGVAKASTWENKVPFKSYADKPYFITAGGAMGGAILPQFNARGASQPSSGSQQRDEGSVGTAINTNSSNANFKAFSGKGVSLGGGSSNTRTTGASPAMRQVDPSAAGQSDRPNRNVAKESKLVQQFINKHSSGQVEPQEERKEEELPTQVSTEGDSGYQAAAAPGTKTKKDDGVNYQEVNNTTDGSI